MTKPLQNPTNHICVNNIETTLSILSKKMNQFVGRDNMKNKKVTTCSYDSKIENCEQKHVALKEPFKSKNLCHGWEGNRDSY